MAIATAHDVGFRVLPETPSLGAVIEGVDARKPLSEATVAGLVEQLMAYKVLFFRRQNLSPVELQRFADHFGPPFLHQIKLVMDEDAPGVTRVSVVPHFHSDLMYMAEPPTFSMLQMNAVPPAGGDTMWADLVSSYDDLSAPMRAFLEPLTGIYCVDRDHFDDEELRRRHFERYHEVLTPERLAEVRAASAPHEHPLVRTVPETGRKNYWLSARFTTAIKELSKPESDAILAMLFAHQLQPRYVYRWKWQPGDVAFWDHRTTLHSGVDDFGDAERHGQRASIKADRPV